MEIRMLAKDGASGDDGCPAAYIGANGDFVIQGQEVDADTKGRLSNPLPGETAVRIAPDVIARAYQRYREEGLL